jgi:hypothetical protein
MAGPMLGKEHILRSQHTALTCHKQLQGGILSPVSQRSATAGARPSLTPSLTLSLNTCLHPHPTPPLPHP